LDQTRSSNVTRPTGGFEAGGFTAIRRWLSAATPPVGDPHPMVCIPAGMPAPVVAGLRFGCDPCRGRRHRAGFVASWNVRPVGAQQVCVGIIPRSAGPWLEELPAPWASDSSPEFGCGSKDATLTWVDRIAVTAFPRSPKRGNPGLYGDVPFLRHVAED
jgi:hypothetical protein